MKNNYKFNSSSRKNCGKLSSFGNIKKESFPWFFLGDKRN